MLRPPPRSTLFPYTTLFRSPDVTSEPTWFTVAPLHASVAVGAVNDGVAVHSIVAQAPALPIVGACVSLTVIDRKTIRLNSSHHFTPYAVFFFNLRHRLPELI